MKRILCAIFCLLTLVQITNAQNKSHVGTPVNLGSSVYTGTISKVARPGTPGKVLKGLVQVGIKLQDPPLVVAVGANAKQKGIAMTADQQRAYLAQLAQKQNAVMSQVKALGGVELGRVSKGHNALIVSVDASHLEEIHGIEGVLAVRPVTDYRLSAAPVPGPCNDGRLYRGDSGAAERVHGSRRSRGDARLGHRLYALQPGGFRERG